MREPGTVRIKVVPRHAWLWELLEGDGTFVLRSMFGSKAVYLHGKIMFCFSAGEDPWLGMLVCTSREHHESLIADFPELVVHPVLGKWLYLSESNDSFDRYRAPKLQSSDGVKWIPALNPTAVADAWAWSVPNSVPGAIPIWANVAPPPPGTNSDDRSR